MRFIASLALGLLATQANVCSALKAYTLSAGLTCTADSDNIHLSYQLNGLDAPAPFSNQIYNVAYRLTLKADNSIVTVPTSAVAATAGCGYSSIYTPGNVGGVNSDSMGATQSGNLALNGTILYHQQVDNVAAVSGTFDVDVVSAAAASLTCINGVPSAQLVPLSYSINGISQLVINSYNYPKAVLPTAVYSFDIQPALNIDPCYVDPKTNNTRVPWRVSGLATLNSTESGIMSIVVTNSNGDLISSWIQMPDANQVGTFTRDPVEPSIISATQPNGPTQVFGRIDFEQGDSTVMCDAQGKSNIMFEVLDYSTIRGGVQTFHYIPGAVDNGQNSTSWLPQAVHRLHTMAATAAPTKAPTAAQAAARQAAAKKAAAAAKAKAAAAATAAAAAAAAAAVPGTTTPCTLLVPPNPLTATGLMTPYVLGGGCTMADTAGFVQAVFIDPATGTVQMYAPLVIQNGKKAAVAPGKVTLPANAVVGLWFGSNANLQMLTAANAATLTNAKCVNGAQVNGALSIFGQVAACNSVAFFQAAALAVFQGLLTVPPLGTAIDGQACPTTRSFFTIDQDPGDNLQTTYLLDANGNTAINTPANLATLTAAAKAAKQAPPTVLTNPGDNPLLNKFLNPTMKCNSWMVPDQSNGNTPSANQPLNEVSAAFLQQAPIARQPALNPMCSVNGVANLGKLNACRSLIGEAPVQSLAMASTATFCKNMVGTAGAVRLLGNMAVLAAAAGPTAGQSLFQFLQDRFAAAVGPGNLMCGKLVPGLTNPLAGGAVIAAQSAFQVADALLVGAAAPDNAAMDPMAELAGTPIGGSTTDNTGSSSSSFPVAIVAGVVGGVVALLIAALVITQVVKKRGQDAVGNTSRREGKV